MRVLSSLLCAMVLVGCASDGTESGNPTRGCTTHCACDDGTTLLVTDADSGMPIGASITVDGASVPCDDSGACRVSSASLGGAGKRDVVVSAPGHAAKTVTLDVQLEPGCCGCLAAVNVSVALDVAP